MSYELSHLQALEAESLFIIREVVAELSRPMLLFSGGKDSAVMLWLAEKAFAPAPLPFPLMHVDTGHDFPEVLAYRDQRVAELGARLVVASVQEFIDSGRLVEEKGPRASRNRLQTVPLLDAIEKHQFDAVFGGARRDEEKARAKERVFSFRDEFGQWDPKNQRPELCYLSVEVLDGDEVRTFLSRGLGFTRPDREENIRRIGYVARLLARHGVAVISAAISPYGESRNEVRRLAAEAGTPFIEVFAQASLDALIQRDVKGLYKKALAGELSHFTGLSDPYEPPESLEVTVRTDSETVEQSVERILAALRERGLLS